MAGFAALLCCVSKSALRRFVFGVAFLLITFGNCYGNPVSDADWNLADSYWTARRICSKALVSWKQEDFYEVVYKGKENAKFVEEFIKDFRWLGACKSYKTIRVSHTNSSNSDMLCIYALKAKFENAPLYYVYITTVTLDHGKSWTVSDMAIKSD